MNSVLLCVESAEMEFERESVCVLCSSRGRKFSDFNEIWICVSEFELL